MTFEEFKSEVENRFSYLKCEETTTKDDTPVYATLDWSVGYNLHTHLWWYMENKSSVGYGKSLAEAMADIPPLEEY